MSVLLEVKNFSTGYQHKIVQDIHFKLHSGEMIAILGPNGCGKSTLLKGLMGTLISEGEVFVDNQDFLKMSVKEKAKHMTLFMQRYEAIEGISALEMIKMGQYAYSSFFQFQTDMSLIQSLSKEFHIEDLLDKDFMSLSEGQKQLVGIVRVLYQKTKVILLDEPDSALDFDNRHMLYHHLLKKVKQQGLGIVVVMHDPMIALQYADRILLMDQLTIIDTIDMKKESVENIETKLKKLYKDIMIKKDDIYKQYYSLVKICEPKEREGINVND